MSGERCNGMAASQSTGSRPDRCLDTGAKRLVGHCNSTGLWTAAGALAAERADPRMVPAAAACAVAVGTDPREAEQQALLPGLRMAKVSLASPLQTCSCVDNGGSTADMLSPAHSVGSRSILLSMQPTLQHLQARFPVLRGSQLPSKEP